MNRSRSESEETEEHDEESAALEWIREYPVASLLGAAAVGFVLARLARRLR